MDIKDNIKSIWDKVYEKDNLPWTMNPFPNEVIELFLENFKAGDSILDYGCGDGTFSKRFIERGMKVTCADISDKALDIVKKKLPGVSVVQTSDLNQFLYDKSSFDGIFVRGVFHHIDKDLRDEYLKGFQKILGKGGTLLISGHSNMDEEFKKGYRVSPTTGLISWAISDIDKNAKRIGFLSKKSGYIPFTESVSGIKRMLKYFFFIKN